MESEFLHEGFYLDGLEEDETGAETPEVEEEETEGDTDEESGTI